MKSWFASLLFAVCIGLLPVHGASAYENLEITLSSGSEISYMRYGEDNNRLVLWLPSEYGSSPEMIETALSIYDEGFDLWVLNLHASYMVSPGRTSMDEFEIDDIYLLMLAAKQAGYKNIVLAAPSRGAILALQAGKLWQQKQAADSSFHGYVFLHPHLIDGSVEIGDDARYLPIARSVNKPVVLLQPEYSTKYLRTYQVVEQLKTGGARVKVDKLKGVTAGFHARPRDDLSEADLAMREQMGEKFVQAYHFLENNQQAGAVARPEQREHTQNTARVKQPSLYAFKGNPVAPALKLMDLYGNNIDLANYRGKVVLINFWATWCGPCVREIPSLNRLVKKLDGKDFQLLTVDIKESPERIRAFFKELELQHDFPVLLDSDGQASIDWKVYAYPSNYLIDKDGKVRYGYRGALEWDDAEIVKIIESLL